MIDYNFIVGIFGIVATLFVAGCVFYLDKRRRDNIENTHKKIIRNNMNELNEIVTQIILDVNDLERDEEGLSNNLNKFLIGNYSNIGFLINNIKLHHTQCTKLSDDEESSITDTVRVVRWILDKYCPQDVPEQRRVNIWKEPSNELQTNARTLGNAIKKFAS